MTVTERIIQKTDPAVDAQPQVGVLAFLLPFLAVLWKDWPKDMEVSSFSGPNDGNFTLRGECPHCSDKAAFMPVTRSWHEENPYPAGDKWIAALRCVSCRKYILGVVGFVRTSSNESVLQCLEYYPLGRPPQVVSEAIPENIREDFNEALRCRWVDAYNATVEMCRRALQASCEELGADPKISIEAQIDWIASQGKITSFLREMAHTIRLAGNRGAHPPRSITNEEADAVIQFTREYFQHVYMTRARMSKYDFSKAASKRNP